MTEQIQTCDAIIKMESKTKQLNGSESVFVVDGKRQATIEDVLAIGRGREVKLSQDSKYHDLLRESKVVLLEHMESGKKVYGATTSYGDAVTTVVHYKRSIELNFAALYNSGCGIGPLFSEPTCRAIMFARLICIAKGHSGVSIDMLRQMELYLKLGIIPAIPEEGSVGASGDLIPMSYIAAALIGERQVYYKGQVRDTKDVLQELGIKPHSFGPKEALSIINSTNVMSVVACEAWNRAEYYSRMAGRITSMISLAMLGNKEHFHPNLFAVRLQKGPAEVANWVYSDLKNYALRPERLQDRYSIRCAPHVLGVLRDALIWTRRDIQDEVNTTNDNPIIDVPNREIYYGGHFYGGYITFAMDSLVAAVVSVADMLERQMSQIVDYKFSNGLPSNLSGASKEKLPVSLAYKNLQIALSSYVAEASKLTIPTSVFSRSTESHNQDKVSMGTIAARYAIRVMTLCEQVTAGCLLSVVQALDLRMRDGQLEKESMGPDMARFYTEFRKEFKRMEEDRDLEDDLRRCMARVQEQKWQPFLESRIL